MNRMKALAVSLVITGLIACAMLAIGASALFNPNGVAASNTPGVSAPPAGAVSSTDVQQLQDVVRQYQEREKQYQSQLDQANAQVQQYQSILAQLQRRGVIRILSDGTIQVRAQGD